MSGLHFVDYRKLRPSNLNSPEFEHLKLLLFWPVFVLAFHILEKVWIRPAYIAVHCRLDDLIPFCEYFLIPYTFWFVFLYGMHIFTIFCDVPAFKRLMKFTIITYTITLIIYALAPNCQNLRPDVFVRDNFLTHLTAAYYAYDTNTNVCPSLHVIGSAAVMFCAWDCEYFQSHRWRTFFTVTAVVISISTVFVKQHSVLDILFAIPVCAVGYVLTYRPDLLDVKDYAGLNN